MSSLGRASLASSLERGPLASSPKRGPLKRASSGSESGSQERSKPKKQKSTNQGHPICSVCCEVSKKSLIECPFDSNHSACASCIFRYLSELNVNTPFQCMHCKKEYSLFFLQSHLSPSQWTLLRTKIQQRLLEPQKSLLVGDQMHLHCKRKIRDLQTERAAITRELKKYKNMQKQETHTPAFGKCPIQACMGYVMEGGRCGMCLVQFCTSCREVASEDHKCDASVKYILNHSKPCPECGIRTDKVDGCNQMWCVQCHCTWNWKTGLPDRTPTHNPHFLEYEQQQQGSVSRHPLDILCGGLPFSLPDEKLTKMLHVIEHVNTHFMEEVPTLPESQDLRLKFLQNEITETQWGKSYFRRYQAFQRKSEFFKIHQTFVLAATDVMQRIANLIYQEEPVFSEISQMEQIRQMYNFHLRELSVQFGGKGVRLFDYVDDEWNMILPSDVGYDRYIRHEVESYGK